LEVANPKLISDLEATSNKLETAKNNQNSNKNKAKTAAAYSKKVEAESVKKGLNDVIPSGTTVAGYNSSTGTFAYDFRSELGDGMCDFIERKEN
jgi:hypothetical protein